MIIAPFPIYIPAFTGSTKTSPTPNQPLPLETPATISPTDGLKTAAANQENLRQLANHLRGLALLWSDSTTAQTIASGLSTWNMPIDPDSSYPREGLNNPSLAEVISQLGFDTPTNLAQTIALRDELDQKALAPTLGNTGGGLSWPLPLDATQQQQVVDTLDRNSERLPGLPLADQRKGALGYLLETTTLTEADLQDPHKALEKLLKSPRAEALGLAIQAKLGGISTPDSLYEYVLSAIHLGLDRESISQPGRTTVAGFNWAQEQYQGKPASTVLEGLKAHLVATGKTTPETAALAAQLLLGRVAPAFLVKDIPDRVVYGSQGWATFCIAVAKVEQNAPGVTAKMTFVEVMQRAEAITDPAPEHAQQAALIDWGLASGTLAKSADEVYSPQQLESVRTAFNDQQDQRLAASASLNADIPTRKDVALKKLKEHFPELDPALFEAPVLKLDEPYKQGPQPLHDPNMRPVGLYFSMVDVFMGKSTLGKWKSDDPRIPIDKINKSPALGVLQAFNTEFDEAIKARKSGIATTVRHLISQLPLEDRKKLESGKIQFFHESTYESGALKSKNLVLSFKVEQGGQRSIYQLDIQNLSITRKDNFIDLKEVTWSNGSVKTHQTEFKPKNGGDVAQGERPSPGPLDSFSSARSHLIADAFVEHMEYDNPAIKQESMGATPHEKQQQAQVDVGEFFLNLIPFRSAIVNFSKGNYAEGALDLGLDIFSFLTAGVGTAARLGKLGTKALSAGAKLIKGAKVIGVAAIGELNPLDGVKDVLVGAAKLTKKAGHQLARGVNTLTGAADSYDLLKASRNHDQAAFGTFKFGDQTVEGVSINHNGNWYAYDPVKDTPYGAPIKDFDPRHTLMPPSPNVNQRRPMSAHHGNRVHPYKRPLQPNNNVPTQVKTDHLPPPNEEYVKHINGAPNEAHFTPSRKQATTDRFEQEMNAFHQNLEAGKLPPRPTIPATKPYETVPDLIEKALDQSDMVFFGESHQHLASLRALDQNIDLLKRKNVKVIGIEGFVYDNHMLLKDDGMGFTGKGLRPYDANANLKALIKKFQDNGIEVVPLDHFYLTRHRHERSAYIGQTTQERHLQRLKEFNYYASRELEKHKHKGKVIALVGGQHINTTQGVTGLAEANGGIGIRVYERAGMKVGYGTNSTDPKPGPMGTLDETNDLTGDLQIYMPE